MARSATRPAIEPIDGTARLGAALLALNGASGAEIRRALAVARRCDRGARLVAADGGLDALRACGLSADLVVGDGDSASGRRPTGVDSVRLPRDKAISDFGAALRELRRRTSVLVVAGLLGGRLDHEWANVQELGRRAVGFELIVAPSARALVGISAVGMRVIGAAGRTFSVLPLGGPATISLAGAEWSLRRRRMEPGSRGLSNLARVDVRIDVHDGAVALVLPRPPATPGRARSRSGASDGASRRRRAGR